MVAPDDSVSHWLGELCEGRRSQAASALWERYFDKLVRVLESYGHRKHPSQTPREFTRSVVKTRGQAFQPCDEVTDLLYRSRYGGHNLTREERRETMLVQMAVTRTTKEGGARNERRARQRERTTTRPRRG